MARLTFFLRSLFSGYAVMGANIIYTLASVRLALTYLSTEEFGLWGLILQIMIFLNLIEAGTTGACARILIDYKDHERDLAKASKVTLIVFSAQAVVILAVGYFGSPYFATVFNVPEILRGDFITLLRGYSLVFSLAFAIKVFNLLLFAFQRNDIGNYAQILSIALQLLSLFIGFALGMAIWSFLLAIVLSTVVRNLVYYGGCRRLGLLPRGLLSMPFDPKQFWEIFHYAKDRVLVIAGQQMLLALPTFLISRHLGLSAVANWHVGTRLMILSQQLVCSILGFAYPALAEMYVRAERQRFVSRFNSLVALSATLAGAGAAMIIGVNSSFVSVWTGGRIEWAQSLNFALSIWLIILVIVRCQWVAISITKTIGFMRFCYIAEAIAVAGVGSWAIASSPELIWVPVLCTVAALLVSFPYTLYRATEILEMGVSSLVTAWYRPLAFVAVPGFAAAAVMVRLLEARPAGFVLVVGGATLSLVLLAALFLQSSFREPLLEMWTKRRTARQPIE